MALPINRLIQLQALIEECRSLTQDHSDDPAFERLVTLAFELEDVVRQVESYADAEDDLA